MSRNLTAHFINLRPGQFLITSQESVDYNCIAWAGNDNSNWWSPVGKYYWPEGVPREETVQAYVRAFASIGFEPCENGDLEPGIEKVALFVDGNRIPVHMARQLANGRWTSKLGEWEDIEHVLEGLSGTPGYGTVMQFLRRHAEGTTPSKS